MERGGKADDPNQTQTVDGDNDKSPKEPVSRPISIAGAHDYDPFGSDGSEYPENVGKAYDGDPGTYWQTSHYASADFGRLKPGVGIVVDLGKVQQVGKVALTFGGDTSVELRSAGATDSEPQSFEGYQKIAGGNGTTVDLKPDKAVKTRYLLVWLTKLPVTDGQFRGRVADIKVTS